MINSIIMEWYKNEYYTPVEYGMGMLLHCESDKMHIIEKLIFFSALTEVTTIFSSCLHNFVYL